MAVKEIQKDADKIRAAYAAGKRTVIIDGVKFNIKKITHNVSYEAGGVQHRNVKECWLSVSRADGGLVPHFNVDLKYQGNLRSRRS